MLLIVLMSLEEQINLWNFIEKVLYYILCKLLHLSFIQKNWNNFFQFCKFAVVGLINNLVFYMAYTFLILLNADYLIANTVAFVISIVNSYYWNSKYVFARTDVGIGEKIYSFVKTFLCYSITGLGVNSILLVLWIDKLGIHEMVAPIINLIITIPLNYILNKFWAFRSKRENENGS